MNKVIDELEFNLKHLLSDYGLLFISRELSEYGVEFELSLSYVDTMEFDETDYRNYEFLLDDIDIKKENYEIYCSYDTSGFDYWQNIMQESNYTRVIINVREDIDEKEINNIIDDLIQNVVERVDDFLTYKTWK